MSPKNILVKRSELKRWVDYFSEPRAYGLDTETYGLRFGDKLFSIILSSNEYNCYFNYKHYPEIDPEYHLDDPADLKPIFDNPESTWYIANAKYDMQRLWLEGLELAGVIHCTEAAERLIVPPNKTLKIGLDGCAKRRGWGKDDRVEKWITDNKASSRRHIRGKQSYQTIKHFNLVPFGLISEYGCADGELVRKIGEAQLLEVPAESRSLLINERRLTKTCAKMERTGIRVDEDYVEKALAHELSQIEIIKKEFKELTGRDYKDSPKLFYEIVSEDNIEVQKTDKGNPSFSKANLAYVNHPITDLIRRLRRSDKYSGTYYSSFLHYSDNGVIHPDMRQAGTVTGRFSYRDPNLQNVPKEDEDFEDLPFLVRKSFVPFENMIFVMIDYKQQEYRMMLDYAEENKLIDMVMQGVDVHQATAETLGHGITRKKAKNVNFSLLYGQGDKGLAESLGCSVREAREIRELYYAKLPKVERFQDRVIARAKNRGWIKNWAGRVIQLEKKKFAYKMPNALIQGGCADVLKYAMNQIDDYFTQKKARSFMQVQVHDEILFGFYPEELDLLDRVMEIMESVYPAVSHMKLEVDVDHSPVSWGQCDRIKGLP